MKKLKHTKFRKDQISKPSLIQLDYDNGLMDSLLFHSWLSGKNTPVQKQSALIKKRMNTYAKHFKLKSFLTLMLVALSALCVNATQLFIFTDKTSYDVPEGLLYAGIEPEAVAYLNFL